MYKILSVFTLFFTISLIGCHSNDLNNNLNLPADVSSIELYEWDNNVLVTTIKDKELIDEVVAKLNSAKTYSTAHMDYPLPYYELLFKSNEQKDAYNLGYYNEVVNLGVKGRYLDVKEDIMYHVEFQLPFH